MNYNKIEIPDGLFIVIEGIDGSGKTWLSQSLGMELSTKYNVLVTYEPSDSEYGKKIRESFKIKRLSPKEEVDLFVKDREFHINNTVKPFLEDNHIVICDRYVFSNIAYQGAYGYSIEKIKEKNKQFMLPDLVIYLDIDIDEALKRINFQRNGTNKVETKENISKVESIYHNLQIEYKSIFKIIDANNDKSKVIEDSIELVYEFINNKYRQTSNNLKIN